MKLSTILDKRLVFLNKHFDTYEQVIDFLSGSIEKVKGIPAHASKTAFMKRENLGTTFFGHKLALPHGYLDSFLDKDSHTDSFDEIVVAFIRLDNYMNVQVGNRYQTIRYVFAILTNTSKAQAYLKILSSIAQLVINNSSLLEQASGPEELLKMLDAKDISIDEHVTASDLVSCYVSVGKDEKVSRAIDHMKNAGVSFLPVVDSDQKLVGIIELADLFLAAFPEGSEINPDSFSLIDDFGAAKDLFIEPIRHFWDNEDKRHIRDFMRPADSFSVLETASYSETVFLITKHHHRSLVVVDAQQKVKGIIDANDLIHKMIRA